MPSPPLDPYARLSLRDRLELLAFEARLVGFPQSLVGAVWEAVDVLRTAERKAELRESSGGSLALLPPRG